MRRWISTLPSSARKSLPSGGLTIRQLLVAYGIVILLPLLVLVAVGGYRYADARRDLIQAGQTDAVHNLVFLIDREIEGIKGALQSLATSPMLQTGNVEDFRAQAEAATYIRSLNSIAVLDEREQILLSSSQPAGFALPRREDLGLFKAVSQGQAVVSGLTYGAVTKVPIFVVTVPVAIGGKVTYALTAGIRAERLDGLFKEAGLTSDWVAVIVGRDGRLLARSRNGSSYVGQSVREDVKAAISGSERGFVAGRTREGVDVSNAFLRSKATGWSAVIAVPQEVLSAPLRAAMRNFAGTALAALLAALAAGAALAAWISRPVLDLKAAAAAVLDAKPPPPQPRHTISELQEVHDVFSLAASLTADRSRLLDILEQAVDVAGLGIFDLESATAMVDLSPMLQEMLGFKERRLSLAEVRTRILPEDLPMLAERARKATATSGDGQFAGEFRIRHPERGTRWISIRAHTRFEGEGGERRQLRTIGAVRDITEARAATERLDLLARETVHRSKNLLAIVQAMASQSARTADDVRSYQRGLAQRIGGLAASVDLLVARKWTGAMLEEVVRGQLAPFLDDGNRLATSGPEVLVDANAAQSIGLALHELATNSVKYGALSVPQGRIVLDWTHEPDASMPLKLCWQEHGGPPVTPPERSGFGKIVMERLVAQAINGRVDLDFAPTGVKWLLEVPSEHIVSIASDRSSARAPGGAA